MGNAQKVHLLGDLDSRCVMHVHQKRFDTRPSFKSFLHIGQEMWVAAQKMDYRLPKWNKLKPLEEQSKSGASCSKLSEVRRDGSVTNEEMTRRGFGLGTLVLNKKAKDGDAQKDVVYKISEFGDDLTSLTLEKLDEQSLLDGDHEDENDAEATIAVNRIVLLTQWETYTVQKLEVSFFSL